MDVPLYQTPEGKDLLPPRLTSEGARVDPNWLLRFLNDPSLSGEQGLRATAAASSAALRRAAVTGAKRRRRPSATAMQLRPLQPGAKLKPQPGLDRNGVRPYLKARMPTFNFSPNELQTLVRFFMAMSGQQEPYIKEPLQPLTEQEKLVARQMFTSGTPCLKCHITGDPTHDAKAIAPNFLLAGERLKPDWTFRWLLDPAQISPGTAMPTGLFRKEGERWVINLPNPPPSANEYQQDHAQLAGSLHAPDDAGGAETAVGDCARVSLPPAARRSGAGSVRAEERAATQRDEVEDKQARDCLWLASYADATNLRAPGLLSCLVRCPRVYFWRGLVLKFTESII